MPIRVDNVKTFEMERLKRWKIPDYVKCNVCNWKGQLKECPTGMESEGWEYPEYEILICPKCGEGDIAI